MFQALLPSFSQEDIVLGTSLNSAISAEAIPITLRLGHLEGPEEHHGMDCMEEGIPYMQTPDQYRHQYLGPKRLKNLKTAKKTQKP